MSAFDHWQAMEIIAVALNIGFTICIALHRRIGWLLGFVASCLSVALYLHEDARVMTGLNLFYAGMGIYGWWSWSGAKEEGGMIVRRWPFHAVLLPAMAATILLFTWSARASDYGEHPFMEVFITVFSFVATWMMARRMVENWVYWFAGDVVAVWFNHLIGLEWYALLNIAYIILSMAGLWRWSRAYRAQQRDQRFTNEATETRAPA